MKQPDWRLGTSCYKSNKAANSSGLKKTKLVLLIIFFISSIVIVFLNLTNIGENTFFVAT